MKIVKDLKNCCLNSINLKKLLKAECARSVTLTLHVALMETE